ncbi:hypothetical protein [Streptomyces sp. NPDC093105]|uniref:hypothetical protein n=1 Tax=Streptomyces sp. NPDC093105 TaxID=3366029 RepID=UPI00381414CC
MTFIRVAALIRETRQTSAPTSSSSKWARTSAQVELRHLHRETPLRRHADDDPLT